MLLHKGLGKEDLGGFHKKLTEWFPIQQEWLCSKIAS